MRDESSRCLRQRSDRPSVQGSKALNRMALGIWQGRSALRRYSALWLPSVVRDFTPKMHLSTTISVLTRLLVRRPPCSSFDLDPLLPSARAAVPVPCPLLGRSTTFPASARIHFVFPLCFPRRPRRRAMMEGLSLDMWSNARGYHPGWPFAFGFLHASEPTAVSAYHSLGQAVFVFPGSYLTYISRHFTFGLPLTCSSVIRLQFSWTKESS